MAKAGSLMFRIGYFLYTRTRVGYYYHKKDIQKARDKYGDGSHSGLTPFEYGNLQILPVPMLMDNYSYIVTDTKSDKSVIIDPGHAEPVQKVLKEKDITPEAILITHKHWDHSGGNKIFKEHFPKTPIYGSSLDHVPEVTDLLSDGNTLQFGELNFKVLFTPGHTVGHIVYLLDGKPFGAPDCLFSGDVLFLAGCGRMFEAPASTMLLSLDRLMSLPDDTLLWPGHEYAKENLEFACHLEESNEIAKEKLNFVSEKRENSLCTCPSTIGEEKQYNPFLRSGTESLLRSLGILDESNNKSTDELRAKALQLTRERKDNFNYKL